MERIRLELIAFDAGTQIREAISEQVVTDYAERMADGAEFPPVVLFADGCCRTDGSVIYYLADGFHRVQASVRNQFVDIPAEVRAGTKDDALWFALGANKANGHRMTEQDKQHAVAIALRTWPERLNREIAEQVGCSHSLVSKVANILNNTGVVGELRGRALANQKKRQAIREMVTAGAQSIEIRDALHAHPTVIAEVRRELGKVTLDRSKEAVSKRRDRMREMASEGFTSRQIAAELGLSDEGCRSILREEGIAVPADAVTGKTLRHDATRIVEHIVMDAENLTADVHLIDFSALDRAQIADWLASLTQSRAKLGAFIKRLTQEQKQHGEAA